MIHYFKWAFIVTAVGLALGAASGLATPAPWAGCFRFLHLCCALGAEISLSFDNAIVNANKLKDMTPEWQHRF